MKEIDKIYEYLSPSYNEGFDGGGILIFKDVYNRIFKLDK